VFAEDQLSIEFHIEDAASALDEIGFNAIPVPDVFRQTGGMGQEVSLHAVFDADFHLRTSRAGGR
jgi:hypothetical protein